MILYLVSLTLSEVLVGVPWTLKGTGGLMVFTGVSGLRSQRWIHLYGEGLFPLVHPLPALYPASRPVYV